MKTSTLLVVGALAVGGYVVWRKFGAGGRAGSNLEPSPTQPDSGGGRSPLDGLRDIAQDGRDIIGAGKEIYDTLFGRK